MTLFLWCTGQAPTPILDSDVYHGVSSNHESRKLLGAAVSRINCDPNTSLVLPISSDRVALDREIAVIAVNDEGQRYTRPS